jgi:hypothetical protein
MGIKVALEHRTYSLQVDPADHFVNWQQVGAPGILDLRRMRTVLH